MTWSSMTDPERVEALRTIRAEGKTALEAARLVGAPDWHRGDYIAYYWRRHTRTPWRCAAKQPATPEPPRPGVVVRMVPNRLIQCSSAMSQVAISLPRISLLEAAE